MFWATGTDLDDFGGGTRPIGWAPSGGRTGGKLALMTPKDTQPTLHKTVLMVGEGWTVKKYYYAGGQRIAMRVNDTLYYLVTDHLGSTSKVITESGAVVSEMGYKPWGEVRYTSGTMPTDRTYTGQISEPDLGLSFYNARWYDSALGRFIQADSIIPNPINTLDWDHYAYARNNPVKYTDPSGHYAVCDGGKCKGIPLSPPNPVRSEALCSYCKSGDEMYQLYLKYKETTNSWWYKEFGMDKDGFTVRDFLVLVMYWEMSNAAVETPELQGAFSYALSGKLSYWCAQKSSTGFCSGASDMAILNYIGQREVAMKRYNTLINEGKDFLVDRNGYAFYLEKPEIHGPKINVAAAVVKDALWNITTQWGSDLPDWGNEIFPDGTYGPLKWNHVDLKEHGRVLYPVP